MLRGIKPSLIEQNLNKILEILQEKNITVLLAGMLSQEHWENEYKKNLITYILNLQKNFKFLFYHFYWMVLHLILSLNLNDGKHPNPKGIKIISKNLEKKLIFFMIFLKK